MARDVETRGLVRRRDWYRRHLIDGAVARRLDQALRALEDYETEVKRALAAEVAGSSEEDHRRVCAALRYLVDGWER